MPECVEWEVRHPRQLARVGVLFFQTRFFNMPASGLQGTPIPLTDKQVAASHNGFRAA
jgi:hypothetical protein